MRLALSSLEAARPVAQVEVVEYSDDDIDDDFEATSLQKTVDPCRKGRRLGLL